MTKRGFKPSLVEGFQQVVDSVNLKRLHHVFIECCQENNVWVTVFRQRACHVDSGHHRHLNVKEDEIGVVALDELNRVAAIRAFPDDFKVFVRLQAKGHTLAS